MKRVLCLTVPALILLGCGSDSGTPSDTRVDAPADTRADAWVADAAYDAQSAALDGPVSDVPSMIVDGPVSDVPLGQPSDGAVEDGSAGDAQTITWPDGRVLTVVEECQRGIAPDTARCPAAYAEGLSKAQTVDAGILVGTAAGRCSEGSYVYSPYYAISPIYCYYDASAQQLIGTVFASDVFELCQSSADTVSRIFVHGTRPPCTHITWEVYRPPY